MTRSTGSTLPPSLPAPTRRLFAHYDTGDLATSAGRDLVALRLAEEGDCEDLQWMLGWLEESILARLVADRGERQLSIRSRSFWNLVLGLAGSNRPAPGEDLWSR